ncbi:hypothetical protein NVV93_11475 [Pseudomonas sp. LS44]|uniref:hypothetical protein n=1 Tax=Pseudomonas sp. LS44 TaxID=1357074 RepID=UPI00215A29CE|nr:hypothetical protein [Pseudomonas sp. LS44]UVE16243.1 hypothetical protein NVV93_11475 [Pseudomonas sp. LS44]
MTEIAPSTTEAEAGVAATQPNLWAELEPEQFHLLRLAPLPTDRDTGMRPLRFVQLGRAERHSPTQSLLRLTIQLPGQRVRREQNVLDIWADHRSKEVRFGSDSHLQVEPQNRGLGRFLLGQGIAWAKQRWAHYRVEGGALGIKDALGDDARARRDHFLQAQGFELSYLDTLQLKAQYSAERVNALHSDWHKDKVQVVALQDAAAMLEQADRNLQEQEVKIRKLDERIAVLRREDGTLRFTITCLVAFAVFQAGLLIWIATR